MVASNTPKPRPNRNSEGTLRKPSTTITHDASHTPMQPNMPSPPGTPPPGAVNPMTHPNSPTMQSSLGSQPPQPGDNNDTVLNDPTQRQVRQTIQFKDMTPVEQAQTSQQLGLDPYAPLKMVQQQTQNALTQGPSNGPIPNELAGPFTPPGVESFPDDFAHLATLMRQGYAPGASPQEHELGQNAHAMMRNQAFANAQNGTGMPQSPQPEPPAMGPPQPPPNYGPVSIAPGTIPQLGSGLGTPQAAMPPSPGAAIGPALLAAALAKRKAPAR